MMFWFPQYSDDEVANGNRRLTNNLLFLFFFLRSPKIMTRIGFIFPLLKVSEDESVPVE